MPHGVSRAVMSLVNSCCSAVMTGVVIFGIFRICSTFDARGNRGLGLRVRFLGRRVTGMLTAATIIEEAERKVRVADSDPGVRRNLERLTQSLNSEFPMSSE